MYAAGSIIYVIQSIQRNNNMPITYWTFAEELKLVGTKKSEL